MAAAVADYRVAEASERKLAKEETGGELTLRLVETHDILAALVRDRLPGQTIVGFAAETETDAAALLDRARRKRRRKGVDLLAVNEVGWQKGFETADNTVTLLGADDAVIATVSGTKREVADALWDAVLAQR
jgi:phosphopantothenoylcysteine decarboxylase/phosphopantothenate--cysteine ligase